MATAEEIMLTFFGKDEVSSVASNINKNVQSMGSTASAAMNNLNSGALQVSSGLESVVSSLNAGKSASETIFGTSSKAETNSVLLKLMSSTEEAATKLNAHVDDVTNSSLVSMQSLIPAMNAFKTATGATDDEIYNATESMANFGAKVLAQTRSTDLAEQAMMDLSKGIKGACASLDQYGITTDALKNTGLWSGEEDDIAGYMAAVAELTGDTKELMQTNEGLDKQIEKAFSSAGKKLGNEFLPSIKDAKRALIDLNSATGGGLFAGILGVSAVADTASQWGMTITNISNGVSNLRDGVSGLKSVWDTVTSAVKGTQAAVEGVADATNTASNISDMAAGGGTVLETGEAVTAQQLNEAASFANFADWSPDTKQKQNYKQYLKYIDENDKQLSKVEKAFEKGNINKYEFEQLSKSITSDKKSMMSLFDEMGELPDASALKDRNKTWNDTLKGLLSNNDEIDDLLKAKDKTISGDTVDELVKSLKQEKFDLVAGLTELDDLPIEISTKDKNMANAVEAVADYSDEMVEVADGLDIAVDGVDAVADKSKDMKKSKQAMEGLEDAAGLVPAELGAEAAATGAEAATASAGFSTLGASITAMLVPLLTIAAVVAVMIPVVVALAAEALIFIRALASVFEALNFDQLDLSGDIDGLKQIGTAIWELCKAMAGLVVTAWLTLIYQGISAIMMFNDPIETAVNELKKTAELVAGFKNINIDESVPSNLQSLSTSLGAVSKAMSSLSSVGVSVLLGSILTLNGYLGTLSDNLGVAKTELTKSAETINDMADLEDIDEGVVSKLGKVTSALGNVGDAMSSLTSVNWDINMGNLSNLGGIFGTITQHLGDAKDEIIKAAPILNEFSSMQSIDDGVGEKLKKVSEALKSTADAMKNLSSIQDNVGSNILENLTNISSITTALASAKSILFNAAEQLNSLNGLPTISDDVKTKISSIGSTAATVINCLKPLTTIAGDEAINSSNIVSKIQQARYAISNTATHLASLSGIATIPDNLPTLLNKVGSSAATVINTLKPLNSIASAEVNSQAITSKIAQARYAISNTATHLGSLAGIATIPDTLPTLLNKVGTSATQVTTAVQHLNTIPVVTASIANVTLAVATIKSAINQLNSLAGTSLNGGISSLLSSVTSAVNQTKTTLYSMSGGFYSAGVNIGQSITNGVRAGLSGLASIVSSTVSSAIASAVGVATSGGARLGQALTTGFKTNLKLADAMSTEMNYVVQAVNNGISSAKQAARNGAQDVVAEFKAGIETGSPGAMAWATYDEMGFIRDFIVSEGKHVVTAAKRLGQNIVTGFGDPSLNIGGLTDPLTSGQFNMGSLGIMETMLSTAPNTSGIGQNVEIHVHEGAVQLDARNLTTRESKQVMINALEGLDAISNVNIRGIGG